MINIIYQSIKLFISKRRNQIQRSAITKMSIGLDVKDVENHLYSNQVLFWFASYLVVTVKSYWICGVSNNLLNVL